MVRQVKRYDRDATTSISTIMKKDLITIVPATSVMEASRCLSKYHIGCVVVVKNNELVGIISERDIATKVTAFGKDPFKTKVSDIMTRKIFAAKPKDSIVKVCRMMQRRHVRHIPVVDDKNQAIGILSMRDLLTRIESHLRGMVREATKDLNIDALTGLYNYRFFNNYLDAEIARSTRHGYRLSLLFIDIDHFKVFNDTLGHAKGDAIIREVGQLLKSREDHMEGEFSLRKSDIAVRVGGDEFVLILPETTKEGALFCAERLRQAVEEKVYLTKKKQGSQRITVSIGVAEFPTDAANRKDLAEKADKALYQAKKLGRNRVYLYG